MFKIATDELVCEAKQRLSPKSKRLRNHQKCLFGIGFVLVSSPHKHENLNLEPRQSTAGKTSWLLAGASTWQHILGLVLENDCAHLPNKPAPCLQLQDPQWYRIIGRLKPRKQGNDTQENTGLLKLKFRSYLPTDSGFPIFSLPNQRKFRGQTSDHR